jgi:hypothetical protein
MLEARKVAAAALTVSVQDTKEKIVNSILDKVYLPDGTARPRAEVERLLLKRGAPEKKARR